MAAPKGNKYGVGHGRPRKVVPEDDELIELGKDLVRWATETTDEWRVQYCQWYNSHGFLEKHWKLMIQKESFRLYYEQARTALSKNYMNGTINQSIAHRFLRLYCPDVKEEENEFEAYKSSLRAKENEQASEVILNQYDAMMNQLSSMQGKKDPSDNEEKS